jgi:uncharacterized protein YukE
MREINERCVRSSRKRYENNSKKWNKQLLDVREANERVKSNSQRVKKQLQENERASERGM